MPSLHQIHGAVSAHREGWSRAVVQLAAPATRIAALGPDRQPVHGSNHDPGATWFELVTRPLWGLAPHAAGGGTAPQQWDELRTALTAAVDPGHPWYIGEPADRDQRIVESAAVGYALAAAPQQMWDPLSGKERDHLIRWLSAAARAEPVDNNWHFFPVLAAAGLRAVGVHVDGHGHLDRLEEFAIDDGWYADGPGRAARDYYVPFGFHFYGLLLAGLGAVDEACAERFRERAATFARQFQHWFAADGAAVPFGRSLGYRFALGSFWPLLAAADVAALPWPVVRGLAERHLAWWWRQPVAHEDGSLSVGYAYPNTGVVEQYMAGGSPYWGMKFFAGLAAPAEHPFWTQPSAAAETEPVVEVQRAPAMILTRDDRGDVVALAGQHPTWNARGGAAKYAKFAYSTLAGFSVPAGGEGLENGAFDSTLALSDDGVHWRTRTAGTAVVDDGVLVLHWQPWTDVSVETRLRAGDRGHIREHRIVTGRALHTAEGGFCVPWPGPGGQPDGTQAGPGGASAVAGGLDSSIVDETGARTGEVVWPMPGSHILFPRTVLPALRVTLGPGTHTLSCRARVTRTAESGSG